MSVGETSLAIGHTQLLVQEYLDLIRQYGLPSYTDPKHLPTSEALPLQAGKPHDTN
jgi:hypothetical protein